MDLARAILVDIESHPEAGIGGSLDFDVPTDFPGYTAQQVRYHVKLLSQAGYLEAIDCSSKNTIDFRPVSLTWAGHEFLDSIRNDNVWKKTKAFVADKGGPVPFAIVQQVALAILKTHIGLPPT